jgi:inosine/xanthosine triphosphatase
MPSPLASIHRIVVGSTNPVKIGAVRDVVARIAPQVVVEGLAVASAVPDQPVGDDETIRGALARAHAALRASSADLAVGIEGGVVNQPDGGMRTCAWAAVAAPDGRTGVGGSLAMPLPRGVAAAVRGGLELGEAMDRLTGQHETKRGAGAVGILTGGLVSRQAAYEALVAYALAPFLTPEHWATPGPR